MQMEGTTPSPLDPIIIPVNLDIVGNSLLPHLQIISTNWREWSERSTVYLLHLIKDMLLTLALINNTTVLEASLVLNGFYTDSKCASQYFPLWTLSLSLEMDGLWWPLILPLDLNSARDSWVLILSGHIDYFSGYSGVLYWNKAKYLILYLKYNTVLFLCLLLAFICSETSQRGGL